MADKGGAHKKLEKEQGDAVLDNLMRELELINLNAMLQYVKNKALEAGDLALQHIKGDNDKWLMQFNQNAKG